jgi:protein-tyrosine-phosphatase
MALSSAQSNNKVFFLRQFDPALSRLNPIDNYRELEVPDPYYEPLSAYQEVLQMVESSVDGLLQLLNRSNR